jgi:LacI family transcriptional regulator
MSSDRITLKDIAKRLNVSPSTVSRALQDHPEIGETTKQAVRQLAEELNYQPNAVALSLRKKKTCTIGVVVPEIVHYFFSSVISGIEDVAYESNYQVILCQSNEKFDHEVMNIQTLANSQVDGILISYSKETMDFSHIESLKEKGVPVVMYDRFNKHLELDNVIVDDFNGAYQATEHLIKNGCKRIVHFKGPLHMDIHSERMNGYLKALKDHGIALDEKLIVEADSYNKGYESAINFFNKGIEIDGIFAVNDLTAVGAMKAIK